MHSKKQTKRCLTNSIRCVIMVACYRIKVMEVLILKLMKTPEGARDKLFEEYRACSYVRSKLEDLFYKRGYSGVATPTLEYYELFAAGNRDDSVIYKLTGLDNRLLAMRPDSTAPIARLTASQLRNIKPPIRLCYSQNVFQSHLAHTGQRDETAQSGIELIGPQGLMADIEVIYTAFEAMRLFSPGCTIELAHAGLFRALSNELSVDENTLEEIRLCIESKNLAALNEILDTLPPSESVDSIRKLPKLYGGGEIFEAAGNIPGAAEILAELKAVYDVLIKICGTDGGKINVDLGLVHRNDYYTGVVFRGYISGFGETVITGGRYDNLLANFGRSLPATGFAVDDEILSRIALKNRLIAPAELPVLIVADKGYEEAALKLQGKLIAEGKRAGICSYSDEYNAANYAGIYTVGKNGPMEVEQ